MSQYIRIQCEIYEEVRFLSIPVNISYFTIGIQCQDFDTIENHDHMRMVKACGNISSINE